MTVVHALVTILLAPIWYPHYLYWRWWVQDKRWTMQKSLDHVWTGNHDFASAVRSLAREQERLKLRLYLADVYLEYGRTRQAREEIEAFLRDHPGDQRAKLLLQKIDAAH